MLLPSMIGLFHSGGGLFFCAAGGSDGYRTESEPGQASAQTSFSGISLRRLPFFPGFIAMLSLTTSLRRTWAAISLPSVGVRTLVGTWFVFARQAGDLGWGTAEFH